MVSLSRESARVGRKSGVEGVRDEGGCGFSPESEARLHETAGMKDPELSRRQMAFELAGERFRLPQIMAG